MSALASLTVSPPPAPAASSPRPRRLTEEQFLLVWDAMNRATQGKLFGCICATHGEPMPCEHVLEAASDPLLELILQSERASGTRGGHNLQAAIDAVAADPLSFEEYQPSIRPTLTTDAEPGTRDKKKIIRERIRSGESVARPGDREHNPRRFVGESLIGALYSEEDEDD